MSDAHQRQQMMQRDVLLVATAGLSLLSGMHFSPWFDPIAILMKPFIAGTLVGTPLVFLYIVSIFISAMTLLLAGIPAAIYERVKGLEESTPVSLGIWFAGTALIGLRALIG